jgi:hypothetical protein
VTTREDFDAAEWDLIVAAPRWVVAAASAAQRDVSYRTDLEIEMGMVASARGQQDPNPFVAEVARETVRAFAARDVIEAVDFQDPQAGIDAVLERVRKVVAVLAAKADPNDAYDYRKWLVRIADVVIRAAKSNDFIGLGGEIVTESERHFRDRLVLALQP